MCHDRVIQGDCQDHERTSIICVTDQAFESAREHGPGFATRVALGGGRIAVLVSRRPAIAGFTLCSSITDRVATLTVRRRCLVCEWLGTVEELETTDEIGPEWSRCHAPTERIEVMSGSFRSGNPHAAALGRLGGLKGGRARRGAISWTATRHCASCSSRTLES